MLTNRLVHLRSRAIDCRIWRHTGNHSKRSNININIKEETKNMVLYLCLSMRQEHTHTQEREQKAYLTFVIVDQQHTWALLSSVMCANRHSWFEVIMTESGWWWQAGTERRQTEVLYLSLFWAPDRLERRLYQSYFFFVWRLDHLRIGSGGSPPDNDCQWLVPPLRSLRKRCHHVFGTCWAWE